MAITPIVSTREHINDLLLVRKYIQLESSAKTRNIVFDMSLKHLKKMMTRKTCYFTGIEFNPKIDKFRRTIDRIDSTKGYTDDNTVPCISSFNSFKDNFTVAQLTLALKNLTKFGKPIKKKKKVIKSVKLKVAV